MTKEDAIKYLKQLYPNGGHCWLDEQRMEAIGMAVNALQEEPVSDIDFEQELYKAFGQVKDFTLGMRIAKRFYDMGKKSREPVNKQNLSNVERTVKDWKEEPVSEDLLKELKGIVNIRECVAHGVPVIKIARHFANWQKETLWKPADGNKLPEIDREIIALLDNGKVVFAHRPNPDGWDGKSLTSGKVEHYTPKTYDKGGWNIPNVKYWLDCNMDSIFKRNNENSKNNKR